MLMNSKLHNDRREAEVNMIMCTVQNTSCLPKYMSTIVLLYDKEK